MLPAQLQRFPHNLWLLCVQIVLIATLAKVAASSDHLVGRKQVASTSKGTCDPEFIYSFSCRLPTIQASCRTRSFWSTAICRTNNICETQYTIYSFLVLWAQGITALCASILSRVCATWTGMWSGIASMTMHPLWVRCISTTSLPH